MVPTVMRHRPECHLKREVRDPQSKGIVIYYCPNCGARASTTKRA